MALILTIDTSSENASLCLAENETCISLFTNSRQKEHASWLHTFIGQALADIGKKPRDLDAVGLTSGPGSYTGLRVGMAAAKGLCYALNIPLVLLNTLEAMAGAALPAETPYICPLIDARRMEVYTAIYDRELNQVLDPCAMILDQESFSGYLEHQPVLFFGSGKNKLEPLVTHKHAIFAEVPFNASYMAKAVYCSYNRSEFADLAYVEPLYLKN